MPLKFKNIFAGLHSAIQRQRDRIAKIKFLHNQRNLEKKLVKQASHRGLPKLGQLRHVGKVMSVFEKRVVQICLAIIVLSGGFMVYANFFREAALAPKFGGQYTEALIGSPLYINPILAQTNDVDQDLTRLIYNGLVRFDKDYKIVPDLAESWTVSDDQKVYTFKLKKGLHWHDGESVSVDDVAFTYNLIQDKNLRSPLARTFAGVTVETGNENEIKFTLSEPFAGFLSTLTVGILPQHLWADISPENFQLAKYNQKPVGTGPYKFKEFTKDNSGQIVSYALSANDDYHLAKPNIETLRFNFYPDYSIALDALKNQQIDGIGFLPKEYLDQVSKRTTNLYTADLSQFTALFLNGDKNALLKNDAVKKAMRLATNKRQILSEVVADQGQIISSPILPGYPGYDSTLSDEYDLAKAQELLKNDKWEMNKDGVLAKKDQTLTFTITTVDQPDLVKLVKLVQDQWQQIGMKIEVNIVPKASFSHDTLPGRDYEILAYGGLIGYDGNEFAFWHSSQRPFPGANLSQYSSRQADEVLEKMRVEANPDEKAKLADQLQKIIVDDEPAIFLYTPTYTYPVSKDVKGINLNRLTVPADRFWNITDWYIKTKKVWK